MDGYLQHGKSLVGLISIRAREGVGITLVTTYARKRTREFRAKQKEEKAGRIPNG